MKKIAALLLTSAIFLAACGTTSSSELETPQSSTETSEAIGTEEPAVESPTAIDNDRTEAQAMADRNPDLSDEDLHRYLRDEIYLKTIEGLDSDKYCLDNIQTVYLSKEYVEQLNYNSQENVYFGFTQSELDEQFVSKKYVFTFDENTNRTTVTEVESYENHTTEEVIQNVAIGSGVLLVCVTVSLVTGGAAPAVSMIFSLGATKGAGLALSGAAIGGLTAGLVKGYETGNFTDALEAAALQGSAEFKWGAILGTLAGGASEAWGLHKATANGLSMNDAAVIQRESQYPLDLISQFKSKSEYEIYKQAGLKTQMVNGKLALVRDIDLNYKSTLPNGTEVTNLTRMQEGHAPIDPGTGKEYQLHHINQDPNGTLAILKAEEHQGNSSILNNPDITESQIDRAAFAKIRKAFWKKFAEQFTA